MPLVEFEPTTPVFEREKTVHALDRPATVSGFKVPYLKENNIREAGIDARSQTR
jgi:hypothetical protein